MGKWTNDNMNANINLPDVSGEDMYGGDYVTDSNDTRDAVQFRLDTINNYQPPETPSWTPESGGEAPRAWDIHYTPSWFVEEQANRKNPTYQADQNWSNEQVDAIANYVSGKKSTNPREWKYGDPGWSTADPLWTDFIKPAEDAYQSSQRPLQGGVQASKPSQTEAQPQVESKPSYYSFHNNKINTAPDTTALATVQNGTNNAPIRTTDEVAKIKEGAPYKLHQVDTSGADYNNLATSGKIVHNVMLANAGSDVKNQKWYQRWTAPIAGSVMSGSGPAGIAKFVATAVGSPIAGLISGIAWAASTGYSYLRGTGKIQGNEKVDKFLELTDILDKKGAQFQGALARGWEKAGGGDLTDWSKFDENMDFFVRNIDTIMHYGFGKGRGSKEYNPEVWGMISSMTPNIGANVVGIEGQGASRTVLSALSQIFDKPEDKIWLERNQTTRANAGLEGVYEIPEELLGTNAITYWADYAQYLYDNGITNMSQLEYEVSTEMAKVYGDLFNTSEFIEHEIGDPGNIGENMQSRVLYGVGKATGDTNLANAAKANTGSLIGDLTGNIPVIPDAARFVAKLFGNNEFLKTSGGIDEVVNTWDMTNLKSTDPSNLTARDRRLSGINEDGSLKSLDPLKNPNTIKNPFERGAERIKQLFQTTNEWRASMAGDSIMNFISTGIEDAMSARPNEDADARIKRVIKFVDELEHPETISADSPFSEPSKTILFNSIKEDLSMAVRQNRQAIDKVITDYANLEPNRQVLNTLAEALGLTPDKVMSKFENEKTVLAQMIINKADENGGTIPSIKFADGTPIPVDSRAFGDHVISMLAPFAGKDAKPYAPQALMTQITSKIGDGVTETLLNKYGIESEGWVYRFGDTIKKLQHLWLLGLSPSYLANNVVNNVLTRSALGYGGFLTPMAINKFTDRFGYTPERFTESMAEGILESKKNEKRPSEKMREAIRAKRKGTNKFLDKVDSKLDWVSEHAGLFGAISGKIEELESKQIYASAMMTYMARTWKPGVNFRKMDPQLENLIRSQNPDMVKAIYDAISSGVSMKEIENAIYGSFVIPSIRDTLIEAAQERGIDGAEDAIIELFDKGGIYTELQNALNGKRGDEIDDVIQNIIAKAEAIANIQLAEDLARRAEQVANDTANYGFAEVIQLGQDMADNMADVWIQSQDANSQLFNRRVREGLNTGEFRKLYLEQQKVLNERWAGVYATAQQNYNGILKGLGFTDEMSKKYIDKMVTKDNLWTTFYQKTQPEAFQPYLDALVWRTEDTFETWDSRVRKAWKDYTKDIKTKYNNTIAEEQTKQVEMDQIFADGLKACLSDANKAKVNSVIVPLQKQIREQRQKIADKNRELRAIADNTNVLNEKNQVYKDAMGERQQLVNDYRKLQKQLYDEIRAIGPQTVAPAQNSVLAEVDHPANIRAEITERRADEMKNRADEFSSKAVDSIIENEDVPKINDGYEEVTQKAPDNVIHLSPENVNSYLEKGFAVPLADIDLSVDLSNRQDTFDRDADIQSLAKFLFAAELADPAYQTENAREHFNELDYITYLYNLAGEEKEFSLSDEDKARMYANVEKYDQDGSIRRSVENIKNNLHATAEIPQNGDYVVATYSFEYGANNIVGAVYHDGKLVAYVPEEMQQTSIDLGNGESVPVLGVSPEHPDQWVYMDGDQVFTEQKRQVKKDNPVAGDAETDSLGALDPGPQANHQITYEDIVPILQEFGNLYKESLNDAMANKTFGSLDAKTKELVRQYIDNDVRTDLMNTKYKTGKFGEMMRDAALLNYSKRYGFDNALTLLFPYQFWQTRSAWNWLQRMGGKGGKMWRRYARLKELEERNKKELLPSKVTGKIGIYLPFLPEWMGDALFMPTSQLSIIGNFLDPLDDWVTDNKAVTATAERYIQEAFDAGDISYPEFLDAMDPAKRAGSAVWQEMFARAQTEGDHDRDLGNLFKQYFGMSLPVSIGKALITGNPDDWTQTPMSRTGTAFRAMLGDNIFGKGIEFAMSAPERAMRKAAVAITGNNDFRYQEFGNFGDYYIRNQLWDMVVEGKISAEDAIKAHIEKDGNKYWDQAAERQRLELLEKTQLLSTTMPFKKMVEDIRNGNQDKLGDDLKYLFAEILTTWTPTTVVRDAERTWRGQSAELSKLYETNDKEGREKFYDENPDYTYKNLRYEADPEQALRSYLYKSINNVWYDLSPAEKAEIKMALGPDFEKSIISKETRAYQTMDIDKLAAYAQALNGSIPYLATEKLNTMNVPKIDTNFIPEPLMNAYDTFRSERDRLYPGMADVDQIYYSLPADQRKIFANANPKLVEYQKWSSQYKKDHPEVKEFSNLQTDYYDMKEAEEVFAMMDKLTLKALTTAAYSGKDVDKNYQKLIEQYMLRSGSTKKYKDFVKNLTDYILGVQ